jgi:uncharacterized DUF497 family protein
MKYLRIIWDDEDLPDGNVQHIAEHELTIEDVEYVLENPVDVTMSKSSGRPCCFGYTPGGDFIIVIYEEIEEDVIYPITAYELTEPFRREP